LTHDDELSASEPENDLAQLSRVLERLPEAIRDKIGLKAQQ
jgi:hypothetical protein